MIFLLYNNNITATSAFFINSDRIYLKRKSLLKNYPKL